MSNGFDYQGIAVVLGAGSVFISSLVTSALAIALFIRQGRMERKIDVTHDLVNGLSEKKDVAIAGAAFAAGKERGVEKERANPMVPAANGVKHD